MGVNRNAFRYFVAMISAGCFLIAIWNLQYVYRAHPAKLWINAFIDSVFFFVACAIFLASLGGENQTKKTSTDLIVVIFAMFAAALTCVSGF